MARTEHPKDGNQRQITFNLPNQFQTNRWTRTVEFGNKIKRARILASAITVTDMFFVTEVTLTLIAKKL